ncbi:hypothetical protein [Faecalibacterium sp. DFI.5.82]|uniref:hypothetical protein n=1 Tax=Faecalibacterium sp. DFI.5.82 TaxID=3031725 RepID=UPI0023AF68CD|nr:hypothetical protein [Faecalibacterium sp. DFI.5.82]MDE8690466.1 hypothetical protein [Faecalibacterium sp. DFI.5.82]
MTEGFNSSIADLPIFEHSFWKKEQFSGGKDILYCFDVKNKMQSGDSCAILKNNSGAGTPTRAKQRRNDHGTAFEDSGRQCAAAH